MSNFNSNTTSTARGEALAKNYLSLGSAYGNGVKEECVSVQGRFGVSLFTADEADAIANAIKVQAQRVREVNAAPVKPKYVSFENSFITPTEKLPYGYDTIVGYLAKNDPDQLRSLRDPVNDTSRDGFACKHKAERQGYSVYKVSAPSALVARGITELNAYPEHILKMRLA